jgi:putative ABC transport system permease protein
MIKNYFKIACRNLIRNPVYSAINILGLALGMAVALAIALWVGDELSVNKNFANYDRVVKLIQNISFDGHIHTVQNMPLALAAELRTKYGADFKSVGLMAPYRGGHLVVHGDKKVGMESWGYADSGIIRVLPLPMLAGASGALQGASMIIDHWLAAQLFGKANPIDQIVRLDNKQDVRVSGVYEDFPHGSAFENVHILKSLDQCFIDEPWEKENQDRWNPSEFQLYAQLQDHADPDKVAAKMRSILQGHDSKHKPEVLVQPMSKWHLYSEFTDGRNTGGAIQFVRMFGLIGLFVLLLACINFMNLATARSERRAREVGIRKAVGSLRVQLIAQFLGESLLISCLGFALALLIVGLSLPVFNQVADKTMSIPWGSSIFWLLSAAFVLFTGLISGSYPALYLSSFNAVKVLKGSFKAGRLGSLPRKALVVFQFTVSVALIIGTLVVNEEIQYAHNRPMGYEWTGILNIWRNTPEFMRNYEVIRNSLLQNGSIADMSLATGPMAAVFGTDGGFIWPGKDPNFRDNFATLGVSPNFGHTVGWQLVEGRDFSKDPSSDKSAIIINQTAVNYMGLKHPLGAPIWTEAHPGEPAMHYVVIGVIRDMIMQSPFAEALPTIVGRNVPDSNMALMTIRLNPSISRASALARMEPVFNKFNPASPFNYWDNEERITRNFVMEERIGVLTKIFAALAIFISCLGLFGLASFTAEQRTREIGVRKVLGASVPHLWGLLSKEFLLLVLLSFLIAVPPAYYFMNNWLHRYTYHAAIPAGIILGTMMAALGITMITVSFQSLRASMANPVKSLRAE